VLPPDVLARFVGSEKLYFGLATAPATGPANFDVDMMPTEASPYVSLRTLTGRSLRRVRVLPGGPRSSDGVLDWAGDMTQPGSQPALRTDAARTPASNAAPSSGVHYDDGFGPMPSARAAPAATTIPNGPSANPAAPTPPASGAPTTSTASGLSESNDRPVRAITSDVSVAADRVAVTPPSVSVLGTAARLLAEAAILALSGPFAVYITALRAAVRASAAAGSPVSIGLGPAASAGLGAGGTLGAGVIFGPDGDIGVYGSASFDVGFVTSISGNVQITVVRGGISSFGGWSLAATVAGGEGIVGGASALFDTAGSFQGVTVQVGVGAVFSPVDFYLSAQRSVATTVGMASALGELSRSARALDAEPISVEVKYRMFIPAPAVAGPFDFLGGEGFGGDGRGFSYNSGSSRGEINANICLTPGGGIDHIDFPTAPRWQESTAYAAADLVHPDDKPDWWRDKRHGAAATRRATLARTPDNLNITIGAPGSTRGIQAMVEQASIVTINAAGALPLFPMSPDIDADVSVMLRLTGSGVEAKVEGEHDGFPCHELYVNGIRLYAFDPVAAGANPTALLPGNSVTARTAWTSVTAAATTGQSLGLPAGGVRAFDIEIPLDPGVGGQSIGMDALRVGDIILSTTDAAISRVIRSATGGKVSHAMLYVDQGGQVVEAVGEGVLLRPLGDALADATVAVAFRVPALADDQYQIVADAAGRHIGEAYNRIGIARQALFQIDQRLCSTLPNGLLDRCRAFAGRIDMGTPSNDSFFCSELVLEAFRAAGTPLTTVQPNWATPGDIAEFRFDYSKLRYIGHLKAAPSSGLFGQLLAHASGASTRPARAMSNPTFSLNWDDVQLLPQRQDDTCWAAAAAMVAGWNEQVSIDETLLARSRPLASYHGEADVASMQRLAQAVGLIAEPPQCYSAEGFRRLLENYGPLWVGKIMSSTRSFNDGHAVVVTGMYSNGTDDFLRITDPWDRVVGAPGAPGSYQSTHKTGSCYIMRYDDFMREYEAAEQRSSELTALVLRSAGTGGRTPNTGTAPAGYAQALERRLMVAPPPSRGAARPAARGLAAPSVARHTETTDRDGVQFILEQVVGMRAPRTQPQIDAPVLAAEVTVDDWPRMPDARGGTFGAVSINWGFAAGAVGNVRVLPINAGLSDGWSLTVTGHVLEGPDAETCAAVTVELRHVFTKAGEPEQRSLVRIVLRGNGQHERSNQWEQQPMHIAA
jgi:hypothetical protein